MKQMLVQGCAPRLLDGAWEPHISSTETRKPGQSAHAESAKTKRDGGKGTAKKKRHDRGRQKKSVTTIYDILRHFMTISVSFSHWPKASWNVIKRQKVSQDILRQFMTNLLPSPFCRPLLDFAGWINPGGLSLRVSIWFWAENLSQQSIPRKPRKIGVFRYPVLRSKP